MARGFDTSMTWTAPYGNALPGAAGVVNPRGSRDRNARCRAGSTSMSSFSQIGMGSAPSITGWRGSETSKLYRPCTVDTNIVSPMKLIEMAVATWGMVVTNRTFLEMAPAGGATAALASAETRAGVAARTASSVAVTIVPRRDVTRPLLEIGPGCPAAVCSAPGGAV